jgi:hypothetical protein
MARQLLHRCLLSRCKHVGQIHPLLSAEQLPLPDQMPIVERVKSLLQKPMNPMVPSLNITHLLP